MDPGCRESIRNEMISYHLLRLVPTDWKLIVEGEISHFRLSSHGQDLTADDSFLILLKYRNSLDEYYYKNHKNRKEKKEVKVIKTESEKTGSSRTSKKKNKFINDEEAKR